MTDKPKKRKKVTTSDIQAKMEQIQDRVKTDLTSSQAMVAVAVLAVAGLLSGASYYLGRRSR